mmetsp:Transcript_20958/g.52942  ORF Transcript_20958/g.52942 Transcript_20958/m.52942 type:complete len:337 (+) Transcript_20958:186-1196(+)|eukprot:CAMPEP_0178986530 /NCGR_PEP_ID=MMETSP0795-20121207/2752_1 /TAXON_ID=88552 /ORGANISM="Amoebophrya sp., Strain Ameob2" /LENGTH=336 /DNA_ID=CAMNT_0020677595 /DNA_START=171 /DNA_END=1181 /DNA_ORIENTATION=+
MKGHLRISTEPGENGFSYNLELDGRTPGRLSPKKARGPYSPVPTHLRTQYLDKLRHIYDQCLVRQTAAFGDASGASLRLEDVLNFVRGGHGPGAHVESTTGTSTSHPRTTSAANLQSLGLVILEKEAAKLLAHNDYETVGTFEQFVLIADQILPMRELYQEVVSGPLTDERDEKTEEIASELTQLPGEILGGILEENTSERFSVEVQSTIPDEPFKTVAYMKCSLEDLRQLPLHYGVSRYDCAKCGITAENMRKNFCYVAPAECRVLCAMCGELERNRKIDATVNAKQTVRRTRAVKPSFIPGYLEGYQTPAERKAERKKTAKMGRGSGMAIETNL